MFVNVIYVLFLIKYKMKNTKEKIITEAARLFMKQGFVGTSVVDIGNAVGISASSLFSHFKSKEEIYKCTVEKYIMNVQTPQKKFEDCTTLSLQKFIDCYLRIINDSMGMVQNIVQEGRRSHAQYFYFLLESSLRDEESRDKLINLGQKEIELWESIIKKAQEKGEIRNDIPFETIAETFYYALVGASYSLSINNGATIKQLRQVLNTIYKSVKN